jgi:hypothetical protein
MKKLLILITCIAITGISCKKFLEISPENQFEIPQDKALQTETDYQMLLNSCYDAMRDGNWMGGNNRILIDLMGDEIDGSLLTGDYAAYYNRGTGIFIGATRNLWANPYRVIYRCNVLLENLEKTSFSSEFKTRVSAEAKFLRGVCHFELVRFFGQPYGYTSGSTHLGIPIRIKASQESAPRSSVADVYSQAINDLKAAEQDLPNVNGIYANRWSAKAYLARIYFMMNDYTNARIYSKEVITSGANLKGALTLENNLMKRFSPELNSEVIFHLASLNVANNGGGRLFDNFNSNNTRPNLPISESAFLFANANPADLRATTWFESAANGEYYINKFDSATAGFQNPIIHLTEMYLTFAESAGETNTDLSSAIDYINQIRTRAGLTGIPNSISANDLIIESRFQRRMEMIAEGDRVHQLKRIAVATKNGATRVPIIGITIRNAPWDCNGMVVQFPDEELQGNTLLEQNPQGGCN